MSSDKVIFYDLTNKTQSCWSPFTWRTRLALNYKKIPYDTVWVSYPDIKAVVGPHGQQDKEVPTLPVIQHGETWVHDSWDILLYLEKTFPDTPSLLVPSVESNFFFAEYAEESILENIRRTAVPKIFYILDERGAEYFRRTREERRGMTLEELAKGATIDGLKDSLAPVHSTLKKYGPYIGGKQFSYQDVILFAAFRWLLAADAKLWEQALGFFGDHVMQDWYNKILPMAEP